MEGLNCSVRHSQLTLPSQEGGGFHSCLKIPEKQGVSPPRGAVGRDPGRRSGAPGLPVPPRLRLRLRQQLTRRLLTKWRRPWKRQPHFVPGRACQQNADLAKAEEQKAAARLRYRERREESEGFHRPPAAERRLSINACLMNKPAIRLMLQVTLSSTKMFHGILMALSQSWFAFAFLVWKYLKRFKRCCCSGMKLELSPCVHGKPEDCFVKLHQKRIFSV
ncbi:uncharacterized protein LOC115600463 [Calypte anna]|uniref:uncharacterized protein LOC115600463 n=1 Tax=Calypte anna TaxID=9244 RepID=UPI0011C349B0|nr:uncharacterized protein LOC115600463 [Calypte anna]